MPVLEQGAYSAKATIVIYRYQSWIPDLQLQSAISVSRSTLTRQCGLTFSGRSRAALLQFGRSKVFVGLCHPLLWRPLVVVSLVLTLLNYGNSEAVQRWMTSRRTCCVVFRPCWMLLLGQSPVFHARRTSPRRSPDCTGYTCCRAHALNSSWWRWLFSSRHHRCVLHYAIDFWGTTTTSINKSLFMPFILMWLLFTLVDDATWPLTWLAIILIAIITSDFTILSKIVNEI